MTAPADKTTSLLIKEKAAEYGFDLCGIARVKELKTYEHVLRDWCVSGMNGDMNYLGRNIEKRINPALLFPGGRSVIVTGLNYYTGKKQGGNGIPVISRYAYGINYHDVIIEKLNKILLYIKSIRPEAEGKSYVDSAPILEKAWAREAGLGWPGRHSILINKKIGSFIFLGIIVLNIDLACDNPFNEDLCGKCKLCVDSCPTGAINDNRTIDARKCIAYLTIESKNPVPEDLVPKLGGRIFGCDRCQEVCPWNKKATTHKNPEFEISEELVSMTSGEWANLTPERFSKLFRKSAIGRRTYDRFMKSVKIISDSKDLLS
jgi:epoxyqueuosine reductase